MSDHETAGFFHRLKKGMEESHHPFQGRVEPENKPRCLFRRPLPDAPA